MQVRTYLGKTQLRLSLREDEGIWRTADWVVAPGTAAGPLQLAWKTDLGQKPMMTSQITLVEVQLLHGQSILARLGQTP